MPNRNTADIKFTGSYGAIINVPQPADHPAFRLGSASPTTIGDDMVYGTAEEDIEVPTEAPGDKPNCNSTGHDVYHFVGDKDASVTTAIAVYSMKKGQYGWFIKKKIY
ncbi:hypothetical protein AGMMS49543_26640 [Betaproteobacteria bacterium]|nr:hypothetical protein AGMMS49543_26640 [Betaproteobacteria bacterium]